MTVCMDDAARRTAGLEAAAGPGWQAIPLRVATQVPGSGAHSPESSQLEYTPQSARVTSSPGAGVQLEAARSPRRSLGAAPNPFRRHSPTGQGNLWRLSSAVSEKASELGYKTLQDLCGDTYINNARLKKIKALGVGAFATVEMSQLLPAEAEGQPQTVAVKRLKPDILELEDDVISFVTETRLLLRLAHPNIVNYIGLGCEDRSSHEAEWRTMFLVQEFANGGSLKKQMLDQMISPHRKLYSMHDALRWSCQIAEGLEYLHSVNPMVIHRDLKAENILLMSSPDNPKRFDAKLCDFGLHKLVRRPGRAEWSFFDIKEEDHSCAASVCSDVHLSADSSSLWPASFNAEYSEGLKPEHDSVKEPSGEHGPVPITVGVRPLDHSDFEYRRKGTAYAMTGQTGAFIYMAPEVLLNKPYNEKVDVFSFACIMYELFGRQLILSNLLTTGSLDEAEEYAYKVAHGYRMPINSSVPEPIRKLISECWAGLPELRPSMPEVVSRLCEIRESGVFDSHGSAGSGMAATGCCSVM